MVSELVLFQLSSFCALVGMTLGWRGVMTRFAGFYDLPTAWNQVFWGIVIGGVYAVMADGLLFQPYYTTVVSEDGVYTGLNIISLMIVVMFASVFSHLLLRRQRVRKGGSQPSSGWALGLAIGGMLAMVMMFRMFEFENIFEPVGLDQHRLDFHHHAPSRSADHGSTRLHDAQRSAMGCGSSVCLLACILAGGHLFRGLQSHWLGVHSSLHRPCEPFR